MTDIWSPVELRWYFSGVMDLSVNRYPWPEIITVVCRRYSGAHLKHVRVHLKQAVVILFHPALILAAVPVHDGICGD